MFFIAFFDIDFESEEKATLTEQCQQIQSNNSSVIFFSGAT